jgi:WD40-like Beta Propeller Repeat
VLVVAAALLAGCTWGSSGSTATQTTPPSRPPGAVARRAGRIVFSTTQDIYVVNGDGTGLQQLTTDPAQEFDPSWSPDGRQIAYRAQRPPAASDIYVMNADGSGQQRIASGLSPAWSPDGAWIAYSDELGTISLVRPDGSASRRVPGTWQGEYPSWSPDGSKLAFMDSVFLPSRRGGTSSATYEVYVINLGALLLDPLATRLIRQGAGLEGVEVAFDGGLGLGDLGRDGGQFGLAVELHGLAREVVTACSNRSLCWKVSSSAAAPGAGAEGGGSAPARAACRRSGRGPHRQAGAETGLRAWRRTNEATLRPRSSPDSWSSRVCTPA